MKTTPLAIDLLRIDGGSQSRIAINDDVVQDYADLIAKSPGEWPFPPVDVFHDRGFYFVGDGFHRVLAGQRAKRGSIPCFVHKGSAYDARIFGMTANDRHGLRMTRADKRACVEWLLDQPEKMTQKEIAEKAGAGKRTIQMIVADRNTESIAGRATPPKRDGKAQIARPSGGHDPFDDTEDPSGEDGRTESDGIDAKRPKKPKPPKKLDRKAYYKQWGTAIGPLVRLVDKIAEGVGEKHDPHQEAIQEALNTATEEMMAWMGVK